jgi:hypothetical protein
LVVVEGDGEVVEEREDARGVVAEAVQEIEGFALFSTAPAFGSAWRLGAGILCVAFFDDAIVSGMDEDFLGVGNGLKIGAAGCDDGVFSSARALPTRPCSTALRKIGARPRNSRPK